MIPFGNGDWAPIKKKNVGAELVTTFSSQIVKNGHAVYLIADYDNTGKIRVGAARAALIKEAAGLSAGASGDVYCRASQSPFLLSAGAQFPFPLYIANLEMIEFIATSGAASNVDALVAVPTAVDLTTA